MIIKMPLPVGASMVLDCSCVEPPQDEPFRVGDVITMGPLPDHYTVTRVGEDGRVWFERIA